jgi:hypothetical protein
MTVRDARERADVLVDDENRLPRGLHALEAAPDLLPDERRQPLGRLVEDQQPRIGHERPADRKHLLLASRQRTAERPRPRGELGKELEHARPRPRLARAEPVRRGRHEVLPDGERGEHLAALRDESEAPLRHAIRRQPVQGHAVEKDLARAMRQQAHDGPHGRGLAHAVAAEQRDHFGRAHHEVHPEQHLAGAIRRFEPAHREHQRSSSPR